MPRHLATDDDLAHAQATVRDVLLEHEQARTSLVDFYRLVMRHELTKVPLIPTAHQKLMFSFVEEHHWCVLRMPVGTSKTFASAAITLWLLGNDPTQRGVIVSRTRGQAQKVVSMVSDYITEPDLNAPLVLIFPWLKRSVRPGDRWTQTVLTVDRPPGIRDPSLQAVGLQGKIEGSRLSWAVFDDTINEENSNRPEVRVQLQSLIDGRFFSRLDPTDSRVVFTNTPWDKEDQTYYLEETAQWPTLEMDIEGYVRYSNAHAAWIRHALDTYLRPSTTRIGAEHDWYRLTEHDPDPEEAEPLWKERYPREKIEEMRRQKLPHEFARQCMCRPLSIDEARCQIDWIERCKARGIGVVPVSSYTGGQPTYTGVDLAFGRKSVHDKTAFFTYAILPDGSKQILDITSGRWTGPEIVDKIVDLRRRYRSVTAVEGNAAQRYIEEFAREKQRDLPIMSITTTGKNKMNSDFGVESVFTELKNGVWIIPCDDKGRCVQEIQEWINECIYYQPPPAHTGDRLMACFIAREAGRRGAKNDPLPKVGKPRMLARIGEF